MAINFNGYQITNASMIFNGILMNPKSSSNTMRYNVEDFKNNRITISFFGTHPAKVTSSGVAGRAGCSFTITASKYFEIDVNSVKIDTSDFYEGMSCNPDGIDGLKIYNTRISSSYDIYNGNPNIDFAFSPKIYFTLILKSEYVDLKEKLYDWIGEEICTVSHGGGGKIIFSTPEEADFGEEDTGPNVESSIVINNLTDPFNKCYDFGDVVIGSITYVNLDFILNNVYRRGKTQPLLNIRSVVSKDIYERTPFRDYKLKNTIDYNGLAYCTYETNAMFVFEPKSLGRHFANFNCDGMFYGNDNRFNKMTLNISFFGRAVVPTTNYGKYEDSGSIEKEKREPTELPSKPLIIRRNKK